MSIIHVRFVSRIVTQRLSLLHGVCFATEEHPRAFYPVAMAIIVGSMQYSPTSHSWSGCVNDSLLYDENLEVAGKGGVVLNSNKFQFAQETVDFAGFRIAEDVAEPLPKYLNAIREYPTPTNIHDIRSWFGLVDRCPIMLSCEI